MAKKFLKKIKYSKSCDFSVLILVTILVIFSVIMVFSASYYKSLNETGSPYSCLKKQMFFVTTGFVLMYLCSYLDYHVWRRLSIFVLALSFLLLIAVIPLGTTAGGATRWIRIGPLSIMPGELAKPAFIIFTAAYLSADMSRARNFLKGILPMVLIAVVAAALIIKQPNLSTAITIVCILLGMFFLAGLSWKWIGLVIAAGVSGLFAISRLGNYMTKRLLSFTHPFEDAAGDGFQAVQSLLALGTGGIRGLGLGKSVQKNLYLPEPQNDFILAIIGEELGFLGVLALMILFLILVWRGMEIAMRAKDNFGMLLAGGISLMIGIQVVLNVAVVTSSMPPTGIALPFISYGGNATWIFMACAGILLNISRQQVAPEEEEKKVPARRLRSRRKSNREMQEVFR